MVFAGEVNFRDLAAGTPTASDNKFVIELIDGATTLRVGESYTITLATASQFQRNGVRVGELSTYTFDPNGYVLTSAEFAGFTGVSLRVVDANHLRITITPVPEPATALGFATAGLTAWLLRRRRGAPALRSTTSPFDGSFSAR